MKEVTVNPDLSATIVDSTEGVFARLTPLNPRTLQPFKDADEVHQFISTFVVGDPRYFSPLPTLQQQKDELRLALNLQRQEALYRNITVPFPETLKEIQFRNAEDRANIETKVLAAVVAPGATIKFTCADNEEVSMSAPQFIACGMGILAAKDAIFYQYKAVKDQLEAATDVEELEAARTALEALQEV